MEWFPVVFGVLKLGLVITTAFFAIKWHRDQAKKEKEEREAQENNYQ